MPASSSFARLAAFPTAPNVEEPHGTLDESLNDALIGCVRALGGSKVVGSRLWGGKAVDAAQRHLLACLNESKPERLDPQQVLTILQWSKAIGYHGGMRFLCHEAGYAEPVPVAPRDEADDLRRQVLEMGKALQSALARIEKLDPVSARAAA